MGDELLEERLKGEDTQKYYSPYRLLDEANEMIASLYCEASQEKEQRIVSILNLISDDPQMSQYQISLSHKALGDYYYDQCVFQSALDHYERALEHNPRISVKRRVKELRSMDPGTRKISISIDTYQEVLKPFPRDDAAPKRFYNPYSTDDLNREADAIYEKAHRLAVLEAEAENKVFDQEYEDQLAQRLSHLPNDYRTEFEKYRKTIRFRAKYEPDSILSFKKQELSTLDAMERSYVRSIQLKQKK